MKRKLFSSNDKEKILGMTYPIKGGGNSADS